MVLIQSVVELVCCHPNVSKELISVAQECYDMADQTTLLCSNVQDKSIQRMIDTTQTISTEMRSTMDGSNNDKNDTNNDDTNKKLFRGKIIQKIKTLMDQSKTKQVLQFLEDINNDTKTLQEKAVLMQQSIQRGIHQLPSNIQSEYDTVVVDDSTLEQAIHSKRSSTTTTTTTTTDENAVQRGMTTNHDTNVVDLSSRVGSEEYDMIQLLNIDDDVQELETTCQRGIMGDHDNKRRLVDLDIIKNLLNGSLMYEKIQQKGLKCQSIVQQMRTLCSTVASLMQAFLTGGCCIQTMTILGNIGNLFRCQTILQIFGKAIQAIRQMIQTLMNVLQQTIQHLQKVMTEFVAAQQIGQFVSQAVQHTKVGQLTSSVVSNLADSKVGTVCSNMVTNIFK